MIPKDKKIRFDFFIQRFEIKFSNNNIIPDTLCFVFVEYNYNVTHNAYI